MQSNSQRKNPQMGTGQELIKINTDSSCETNIHLERKFGLWAEKVASGVNLPFIMLSYDSSQLVAGHESVKSINDPVLNLFF